VYISPVVSSPPACGFIGIAAFSMVVSSGSALAQFALGVITIAASTAAAQEISMKKLILTGSGTRAGSDERRRDVGPRHDG
jgi:hypothetical protein